MVSSWSWMKMVILPEASMIQLAVLYLVPSVRFMMMGMCSSLEVSGLHLSVGWS